MEFLARVPEYVARAYVDDMLQILMVAFAVSTAFCFSYAYSHECPFGSQLAVTNSIVGWLGVCGIRIRLLL